MEKPPATKLSRLPPTHRIEKRALLRPPIVSPYRSAASAKVVWVKARTPFRATIARVNGLLEQARKREDGATRDERLLANGRVDGSKAKPAHKQSKDLQGQRREGVFLKGAGKAIKRVLELGLWFQQRSDLYKVEVRTGETTVVDDVEKIETEEARDEAAEELEEGPGADTMDVDKPEPSPPPTRLRKLNTVEVEIRLL